MLLIPLPFPGKKSVSFLFNISCPEIGKGLRPLFFKQKRLELYSKGKIEYYKTF